MRVFEGRFFEFLIDIKTILVPFYPHGDAMCYILEPFQGIGSSPERAQASSVGHRPMNQKNNWRSTGKKNVLNEKSA